MPTKIDYCACGQRKLQSSVRKPTNEARNILLKRLENIRKERQQYIDRIGALSREERAIRSDLMRTPYENK